MFKQSLRALMPAMATFILLSAMQDPQDPPPPVSVPKSCQGCVAEITSELPASVTIDGFPVSGLEPAEPFNITWTIAHEIKNHGLCGDLEGSCLKVEDCLVLKTAVGTCDEPGASFWLSDQPFTVSAGVNICGDSDEDQVTITGGKKAEIKASCSKCSVQ